MSNTRKLRVRSNWANVMYRENAANRELRRPAEHPVRAQQLRDQQHDRLAAMGLREANRRAQLLEQDAL